MNLLYLPPNGPALIQLPYLVNFMFTRGPLWLYIYSQVIWNENDIALMDTASCAWFSMVTSCGCQRDGPPAEIPFC